MSDAAVIGYFLCPLKPRIIQGCVSLSSDVAHLADSPTQQLQNAIYLSLPPSSSRMGVMVQHKGDFGLSSGLKVSCEPSSPLCDLCSDA